MSTNIFDCNCQLSIRSSSIQLQFDIADKSLVLSFLQDKPWIYTPLESGKAFVVWIAFDVNHKQSGKLGELIQQITQSQLLLKLNLYEKVNTNTK